MHTKEQLSFNQKHKNIALVKRWFSLQSIMSRATQNQLFETNSRLNQSN